MSDALSLFPVRIAIGQFTDEQRRTFKVYSSPEFNRALSAVFERIGGAFGLDTDSVEALASFTPAGGSSTPNEGGVDMGQVDAAAEVASLREQLAAVTAQLDGVAAMVGPLLQRLESLEIQQPIAPVGADWEHPGKIGAKTPSTGSFTSIAVTSTATVANLHAAVADSLGVVGTYPANATDLATVITLANAIKANNVAKNV